MVDVRAIVDVRAGVDIEAMMLEQWLTLKQGC